MGWLSNPFLLSLVWLIPFFVMAFLAGYLNFVHQFEGQDDIGLKLNTINIILITLIAVRDITLVVYYRKGEISIYQDIWPFLGIFILLALTFVIGVLYGQFKLEHLEQRFRRLVRLALILLLSIIIAAVLTRAIESSRRQIDIVVKAIENFLPKSESSDTEKGDTKRASDIIKQKRLIKLQSVPVELYPPEIDSLTTNPVQQLAINAISVWYQPNDPFIADQSRGVTVYITKQANPEKAAQFLWPSRKKAYPLEGSIIKINDREMYSGFNVGYSGEEEKNYNRPYQTCLIAWSNGPYTFEIYASLEEYAETNKDLLLTLAKNVAKSLDDKSRLFLTSKIIESGNQFTD